MTTVQLCITVRPCVKEFVKREAKKRQLSISRYIESKIYNDDEHIGVGTLKEFEQSPTMAKYTPEESINDD